MPKAKRAAGKGPPVEASPGGGADTLAGRALRGIGGMRAARSAGWTRSPLRGVNPALENPSETRPLASTSALTRMRGLASRAVEAGDEDAVPERQFVATEDELSEEIRSEISTHEQEIEQLRNEMTLLRERRMRSGMARAPWMPPGQKMDTVQGARERHEHCTHREHLQSWGSESEADSEQESEWQECRQVTVRPHREAEKDAEQLRRDLEVLRDRDRERQVEVEEQVTRWRKEADESVSIAEELRALVVERERQVREKEQRLQDVRAEARQAKREVKLIADTNRELTLANRELEASRYAAQLRVQRLEADLKELKRASKQVLERNEVLTKLLKDHRKRDKDNKAKRLRAVQAAPAVCEGRAVAAGGEREWQEAAGKRGGARERGTRADAREGSEDNDSAVPAVLPLEESDALRLLEAQLDSMSRQWAKERTALTSEAQARQDTLVAALEAADAQGEQARREAQDLKAHAKAALAALLHQLAGLATDIESFAASCVFAPTGLAMTLTASTASRASPGAASSQRRTSKTRVSFSDLQLSDSPVVLEGLESADGLGSLVAVSRDGCRLGVSDLADLGDLAWEKLVECRRNLGCSVGQWHGGGEGGAGRVSLGEGAFEEMRRIIEDMCSAINQLARERDEAARLAEVSGSQLRELRESQVAQGNASRREEQRRHNVERQLEAAKEALSLCQAELESVQEELHTAHCQLRLQPIPEEHGAERRGEWTGQQPEGRTDDCGSVMEQHIMGAEKEKCGRLQELTETNGLLMLRIAELEATNREMKQELLQMKQELLVMANQAAVLRGELNGVAAENVRLLGLTGSPECPPGGAAAIEGSRAAGLSGCAKDEEGLERRNVTIGAAVTSPKREGGENPSPLWVDKDTEATADAVQARAEISRMQQEIHVLHRSCAQALEEARQARDTTAKEHSAQLDAHAAVDAMSRQLLRSVLELENCLQAVVGRIQSGATDAMAVDMSMDSLVNGVGACNHGARRGVTHVSVVAEGGLAVREEKQAGLDTSRHIAGTHDDIEILADQLCQERQTVQELLNWQHAAVAEVAGLRDREAKLTAEHAAVSSELSRVQAHMARMLASLTPAKSSHGRSRTGGTERLEDGGRQSVDLRAVWSLPPDSSTSVSKGLAEFCPVDSRAEVLEKAMNSRPEEMASGNEVHEGQGGVSMPSSPNFRSAAQSTLNQTWARMHEDTGRPKFESLLYNLRSGV